VFGATNYEAWTSGTSEGIGCEKTWGWCPSGKVFNYSVPWNGGIANMPGIEKCATVQTRSMIFNDRKCSERKTVICEVIPYLGLIYQQLRFALQI
jgi:hypothetical protein